MYNIKSHSLDLWVISSRTCESYQVICILIWLRLWCCIVNLVSNIKLSLVSNVKTRFMSSIKSSILIEGTLWEWISNCGDDLVLYQDWILMLYQDYGPPFVEVVILCDILIVMVTERYKSPIGIIALEWITLAYNYVAQGNIYDNQYVWNNSSEYEMKTWIKNTHMDHALII